MSAGAKSMIVFAVYLFFLGVTLVIAPNAILVPFGNAPTSEVWIRIVGMVVLFLAYYYARAARENVVAFFRWTVPARLTVPVFFVSFVALGLVPPTLLLFALPDLAGAIWTHLALRAELQDAPRLKGGAAAKPTT